MEERAVRRGVGHADRGALRERAAAPAGGTPGSARRPPRSAYAPSCALGGADHVDAVAGSHALHVGADRFDLAGRVRARDVGQRGQARVRAGADVRVDRVDAGRADAHEHLRRPGLRDRERLRACMTSGPPNWRTRMAFISPSYYQCRAPASTRRLVSAGGWYDANDARQAPQDGRREGRPGPGRRRRAGRRPVDDDDRHGRRARDRRAVHRARRGRLGDGARHGQPARGGGRRARDQAAHARRRLRRRRSSATSTTTATCC